MDERWLLAVALQSFFLLALFSDALRSRLYWRRAWITSFVFFVVMGIATFITRALPFVALAQLRVTILDRFGKSLPPMIMVVLVCGLMSLKIESALLGC